MKTHTTSALHQFFNERVNEERVNEVLA